MFCNALRLHLLASETQATKCVFRRACRVTLRKHRNIQNSNKQDQINVGATAQTLLPLNLLQYSWCNIASPLTQSCDMVLQREVLASLSVLIAPSSSHSQLVTGRVVTRTTVYGCLGSSHSLCVLRPLMQRFKVTGEFMQLCIICAVSKIDTGLKFTQLWSFNETRKLIEKFI